MGPKRGRGQRQGAKAGWNLEGLSGGPEWRETRRKQVRVWASRGQQRLAQIEGAKLSRNFTDSRELGAEGVGERQRPTCQGQELVKKTRRGPSPPKEIQRGGERSAGPEGPTGTGHREAWRGRSQERAVELKGTHPNQV